MIESISQPSGVQSNYSAGSTNQNKLSSSDYEAISSILSQYDASNLTQSDAKSIAVSFKEEGIRPSHQLVNAMDSLGFSAQEVGELAGVDGVGLVPPPPPAPPPPPPGSNTLSDLQVETMWSILAEYDADNLTQSEAEDIDSALRAAGIQPSAEHALAMEEFVFDARGVGDLAEAYRGSEEYISAKEEEEDTISSLLDTLFTDSSDEDGDDDTSINDVMEYTSRILNLNNESKSEIISMLSEFSSEDSTYSMEGIKNSLGSILGDTNNYNRVSIYA